MSKLFYTFLKYFLEKFKKSLNEDVIVERPSVEIFIKP